MIKVLICSGALLAVVVLSACGHHESGSGDDKAQTHGIGGTIHLGPLGIGSDEVTIHSEGHPDARILAGGRLVIDNRELRLTDAQREQVRAYHEAAMLLGTHGKDVGIAGAKVGAEAVGAVVSGLLKGEPDSIGPKVEAKAEAVKQAAGRLCDDVAAMRRAQDALAADLEAFRPYATIDDHDVADCREGTDSDETPATPATEVPVTPATEVPPAPEQSS